MAASSSSSRVMIKSGGLIFLVLGLSMLWTGAVAQSSDCNNVLLNLAPCLSYVTGQGSGKPSSSCCSSLATVVQTRPICLCTVLNSGGSIFGITIDRERALALPGACNVKTPPISRCNGVNGPAPAPGVLPVASPASSPLSG